MVTLLTAPVIIAAISYFYVWGAAEAASWMYDRAANAGAGWELLSLTGSGGCGMTKAAAMCGAILAAN